MHYGETGAENSQEAVDQAVAANDPVAANGKPKSCRCPQPSPNNRESNKSTGNEQEHNKMTKAQVENILNGIMDTGCKSAKIYHSGVVRRVVPASFDFADGLLCIETIDGDEDNYSLSKHHKEWIIPRAITAISIYQRRTHA